MRCCRGLIFGILQETHGFVVLVLRVGGTNALSRTKFLPWPNGTVTQLTADSNLRFRSAVCIDLAGRGFASGIYYRILFAKRLGGVF